MSEEGLRQFLEHLNRDKHFRERVQKDTHAALKEYDLTAAELSAVGTGDEDSLRRLLGADVSAFSGGLGAFGSMFWCTPPLGICITSGSKRDCGTGPRGCGTAGSGQGCGTGGNCRLE
jgi:hypothetical protein